MSGIQLQILSYLSMAMFLAIASIIDIRTGFIPNKLIVCFASIGIILVLLTPGMSLLTALLGCITAGGSLFLIRLMTGGGIGMGDVKLFASAGIFLGLQNTLSAMLLSTVISGLAGLVMIAARISKRKRTMPFAPFIFIGCVLSVALGW